MKGRGLDIWTWRSQWDVEGRYEGRVVTFAHPFLRADHGVVFENVQGKIDLRNRFLVGQSALQRIRTGVGHDEYRCVDRNTKNNGEGVRREPIRSRMLLWVK